MSISAISSACSPRVGLRDEEPLGVDADRARVGDVERVLGVDERGDPSALLRRSVSHEDIEAIVGDAAETALENFVYATSGGDPKAALSELQRLAAAGTDRAAAISALGRHFTQLHRVASAVASGQRTEDALRSLRPPPRFKRREDAVPRSLPEVGSRTARPRAAAHPGGGEAHAPLA